MLNARILLAALVVVGATLAACSGNFGAGTSAPGQMIPSGPFNPATPSPTPNSASGIVTYGQSTELQPIPTVAGYGGAIAFPVPSPKPSGFDNVPVGVTVALVAPTDAPDLNSQVGGKKPKRRERPARPLLYVTLLATRDITLATFPRIALDVPRDVVTTYREEELGLAYYNSAEKTKTYRLAVAERESVGTPPPAPATAISGSGAPASGNPGSAAPSSTPAPTPSPTPSGTPGPVPSGPRTPTPVPIPSPSPTLPPQRITFAAAAGPIKLSANKPVVFALYALPLPSASASPRAGRSARPRASASPSPDPGAGGSIAPVAEPSVPAASGPSAPAEPAGPAGPVGPGGAAAPATPGRTTI